MPASPIQQTDTLLAWIRSYFAICAFAYLSAAVLGGLYANAKRDRWLWILPLTALVYAVSIPCHWSFTNDDSYIFYRYAENLAKGLGVVYNNGVACEGFTSPAWTYILAATSGLGFNELWASKVIGAVFGALSVLMVILAVRKVTEDSRIIFLAGFFVTTNQIFLSWVPSGMDTALFVAWLSAWAFLLARNSRGMLTSVVLLAVGVWIRPEAYFISIIGIAWLSRRTEWNPYRTIAFASVVLLLFALPFLWRYLTFGELLPTTYFAKSDRTIRNGLGFLFGAINGYGAVPWTVAIAGVWALRGTMPWAGISVLAISAYVVWVGGDVLTQRFSLWWLPFFTIGLAAGLRGIATSRIFDARVAIPLIATLLAGQELHRMYTVTRPTGQNEGYAYVASNSVHTAEADVPIGQFLRLNGLPTDTVVTDNIGAIGYFSGMVIVDVNGLIDRRIAQYIHEDRKGEILKLVESQRPQWIVAYEVDGTDGVQLPNIGVLPPQLSRAYTREGRWQSRTGYTRLLLKRN